MAGTRHSFAWGVVGSAVLSLVCASAGAQTTIRQGTATRIQSIEGVDTFRAYCAVCHGEQAKGNGPAASALKKAPADLTGIAKRHNGKFSQSDVEAIILGNQVLASHGSREMPIWGPVFQALEADTSFAKLRVANLVEYLRTIQAQ
jgi:mono/diheme cytochrome c family protein